MSVARSCLTLCNPMDCSPPPSSVHAILQERILEWVGKHPLLERIFPDGSVVRSLRAAVDVGSILGSERSSGGGHGNPLKYSCLENPMNRGAWSVTVYRISKSWTQLTWLSMDSRHSSFWPIPKEYKKYKYFHIISTASLVNIYYTWIKEYVGITLL